MKLNHTKIGSLVTRIKEKDSQAFTSLYEQTYQTLYYLALSILKNEQDAQDAVQESYIKILAAIDTLTDTKLFIAWANRITYNVSLRILEKRRDIPMSDEVFSKVLDEKDENNPLASSIKNEKNRTLMKLVNELNTELRTTIILKYFEDMKINEISLIMDCPVGTVKSRLNTAKKQLLAKAVKERSDAMLLGAFGFLPLRSALLESAGTIGMQPQAAFSALTNALSANGMQTNIQFNPTANCATHIGISAGTIGVAVTSGVVTCAVIGTILVVSLTAPVIESVTVADPYIPVPATITVTMNGSHTLSELYAISSDGRRYNSDLQNSDQHTISVDQNGTYTLYAVGKNKQLTTQTVEVSCLDDLIPVILDYNNTETKIIIQASDTGSGIDYSSIYGVFPNDKKIYPISTDENSGTVVFSLPEEDFTLYMTDLVGNTSKSKVVITFK